jgi:hypothetical protein
MDVVSLMKKISNKDSFDNGEIWRTFQCAEQKTDTGTCTSVSHPVDEADKEETYQYKRSNKSCITLTVGDQGSNKNIRGVKSRSNAAIMVGVRKFPATCTRNDMRCARK